MNQVGLPKLARYQLRYTPILLNFVYIHTDYYAVR